MIQHAQAELPNECCGLLAGVRAGDVLRVEALHRLVNAAASPIEYLSDPASMFTATKAMRQANHDILAIYHSHPTSAPIPSRTDMKRCYSLDVVHFILGYGRHLYLFPQGRKAHVRESSPVMRGWWLTETTFAEAAWEIIDEPGA
jgi:proteasome lid subunit RPN8/RPN11